MPNPRVTRGRRTQALVAEWYRQHGWPGARSREASLPGTDIYDTDNRAPIAPEVKATKDVPLSAALRQAKRNGNGLPSFVVYRPVGYGESRISEWLVIRSLEDDTELLKKAGYLQ